MTEGGQAYSEGEPEFAVIRYLPDPKDKKKARHVEDLPIFLVQVKSETQIGTDLLRDPIGTLRRRVPRLRRRLSEPDVRAMVLRVNAEIPANPKHRNEVWVLYPGSTTAVGIQYKYDK